MRRRCFVSCSYKPITIIAYGSLFVPQFRINFQLGNEIVFRERERVVTWLRFSFRTQRGSDSQGKSQQLLEGIRRSFTDVFLNTTRNPFKKLCMEITKVKTRYLLHTTYALDTRVGCNVSRVQCFIKRKFFRWQQIFSTGRLNTLFKMCNFFWKMYHLIQKIFFCLLFKLHR